MTTTQTIRQSIGKNVKHFREEEGLTQELLAEKINVSTSHIANIECGKTWISDKILCSICNFFNKKPSEIFNDIDTDIEIDRRVVLAVNSSVREELRNLENNLSSNISRRLMTKANSVEYTGRRNERIALLKVASPKKKK